MISDFFKRLWGLIQIVAFMIMASVLAIVGFFLVTKAEDYNEFADELWEWAKKTFDS